MAIQLSSPPSIIKDFNNPAWTTWFHNLHETLTLNKHLSFITTATSITADKESIIIATALVTITLPTASDSEGLSYYIKRVVATAGNVVVSSSDNIDGAATVNIATNYDSIRVFCDGTTWHTI